MRRTKCWRRTSGSNTWVSFTLHHTALPRVKTLLFGRIKFFVVTIPCWPLLMVQHSAFMINLSRSSLHISTFFAAIKKEIEISLQFCGAGLCLVMWTLAHLSWRHAADRDVMVLLCDVINGNCICRVRRRINSYKCRANPLSSPRESMFDWNRSASRKCNEIALSLARFVWWIPCCGFTFVGGHSPSRVNPSCWQNM